MEPTNNRNNTTLKHGDYIETIQAYGLSLKQWQWVTTCILNPSWTNDQISESIGIHRDTYYRWDTTLIQQAIKSVLSKQIASVTDLYESALNEAWLTVIDIMHDKTHGRQSDRLRAAQLIIEHSQGKPTQKIESVKYDGGKLPELAYRPDIVLSGLLETMHEDNTIPEIPENTKTECPSTSHPDSR